MALVNRGQAAVRALAAVAELNREGDRSFGVGCITTVAVHTDTDADAWFVRQADEAICLGTSTYLDPVDGRQKSRYLDDVGVVAALQAADVDAVWVGWGLGVEPASFVQRCEDAGILVVGPDSDIIRAMSDEVIAKRLAEKAGVPVVPWHGAPVDDVDEALAGAQELGYPLVLKASAVAGGRGGHIVHQAADLPAAFTSLRSEAELALGDQTVFLEEFIPAARDVAVQVVADDYGTVWALGVRDGSTRRGTDPGLLEESGSPTIDATIEAERSKRPPYAWP